MKKINLFFAIVGLTLLLACGKKNNTEVKNVAIQYFQTENVLGYGKISIGQIRDQSKIENIPFIGGMVKQVLDRVNQGVDLKDYLYLCSKSNDKGDIDLTVFAKVNNPDSLSSYLKERGNNVEESGNLFAAEEDGMALVFNDEIAILQFSKEASKSDLKSEFKKLIVAPKAKASSEVSNLLNKKAPIAFTISMDQLQRDGGLVNLPMNDLIKGMYQSFDLQFNNGNITLSSELLGDKNKLKDFDYLNHSNKSKTFKLSGTDAAYLLLNVNFAKLEQANKKALEFITEKLDLDEMEAESVEQTVNYSDFGSILNGMKKFVVKDHPLTSMSDGIFFITAEANPIDLSKPQLKFYLGSHNKDLKVYLSKAIKTYDTKSTVVMSDEGIEGIIHPLSKTITYLKNADFSKEVFKLYFNFSSLDNAVFNGLEIDNQYTKPLKDLEVNFNSTKGKIVINLNDQSTNALESLVKYYASIFTE